MPIYSGLEVEVRMATATSDLTTATAIPYISSITYDFKQGIKTVPKGLGMGRQQEVHETLIDIQGTIKRTYDETKVSPDDKTFREMWGVGNTGKLTEWCLEIKNVTSGTTDTLTGVKGEYTPDYPGEGFIGETVKFWASTVDIVMGT
jgi:hypothetical protein